ncbi:MAG: LuxR C-terminal-related transcriptional regulator [Planctomycetaceae bacterium]
MSTVNDWTETASAEAGETGNTTLLSPPPEISIPLLLKVQTQAISRLEQLSAREFDVLRLVVAGLPNKSIAYELRISAKTVEKHRSRLSKKLGAGSLPDLVRVWFQACPQDLCEDAIATE